MDEEHARASESSYKKSILLMWKRLVHKLNNSSLA